MVAGPSALPVKPEPEITPEPEPVADDNDNGGDKEAGFQHRFAAFRAIAQRLSAGGRGVASLLAFPRYAESQPVGPYGDRLMRTESTVLNSGSRRRPARRSEWPQPADPKTGHHGRGGRRRHTHRGKREAKSSTASIRPANGAFTASRSKPILRSSTSRVRPIGHQDRRKVGLGPDHRRRQGVLPGLSAALQYRQDHGQQSSTGVGPGLAGSGRTTAAPTTPPRYERPAPTR